MKTEFKVMGVVAMTLLGIELAMRPLETRLSLDIAHIRSIPDVAAAVSEAADSGRKRILFLGNSLTRSGVDDAEFLRDLGGLGIDASTHYVYPDGSSITLWTYAYRDQFVRRGIFPDILVVGFGRSHLRSGLADPTVLSFYAGREDIGRVLFEELPNIDADVEFLLSKVSVAYAHRNRVQPRLFSELLPHYQEAFREINALRIKVAVDALSEQDKANQEHPAGLQQFLDLANRPGVTVVFVALPTADAYPISESEKELIQERGAILLDFRELPGIGAKDFPDGYHLGARGATLFTEALAEAVAPLIKKAGEGLAPE